MNTRHAEVAIDSPAGPLAALEQVPPGARGVVIFAHGSGSSRLSPRNRYVAGELAAEGFASLLLDLLTPAEEALDRHTGRLRFDVGLLAERVALALEWSRRRWPELPAGLFGASTGAAAALVAAAERPSDVAAIVSRGGRPDLAGPALPRVAAPTLLIVGANDDVVLRLNQEAAARMRCLRELRIIPGAGHLFEEPGALETVAKLARDWFARHLA
jgi:putative phosphoribosyl transferase